MSLECLHIRIVVGLACKVVKSSDSFLELLCRERRAVRAFLFRVAEDAAEKLGLTVNFSDVIEQQKDESNILDLEPLRLNKFIKTTEHQQFYGQDTEKSQHRVFYKNIDSLQLSKN